MNMFSKSLAPGIQAVIIFERVFKGSNYLRNMTHIFHLHFLKIAPQLIPKVSKCLYVQSSELHFEKKKKMENSHPTDPHPGYLFTSRCCSWFSPTSQVPRVLLFVKGQCVCGVWCWDFRAMVSRYEMLADDHYERIFNTVFIKKKNILSNIITAS